MFEKEGVDLANAASIDRSELTRVFTACANVFYIPMVDAG